MTLAAIKSNTDALPQIAEESAAIRKDMAELRRMVETSLRLAEREGRITELKDKDAEIARLAKELQELQEEVSARAVEKEDAALADLLNAGDLTKALAAKIDQVERRRGEVANLAQDLFELGSIHELRFDWPKALDAYREAWRSQKNPQYGLR